MLWLAGQWDRDLAPPLPAEPLPEELERYVEGFGRAGDCGVVAESAGLPVGAAWYRRFPADRPGYGYVSEDIPECLRRWLRETGQLSPDSGDEAAATANRTDFPG